jgi:hypothetical protein
MRYSGAQEKLIHEKNLTLIIWCQTSDHFAVNPSMFGSFFPALTTRIKDTFL